MRHVLILGVLVLTACQPAQDGASNGDAVSQASASAAPAAPASAAPAASEAARLPEVTLTANGIVRVGAIDGRGTATTLGFGQSRETVLAVMAVEFPEPRLSRLDECGAGPMEFAAYGPLKLNFLDGRFVGWFADQGAEVVTVDGFQLGATLAEMRRERSVERIADSTLEGEFEYASGDGGAIGGFFEGAGEGAKVRSFHAGVNCFFR